MRYVFDEDASRIVIKASSSVHPIHTEARIRGWIELDGSGPGSATDAMAIGGRAIGGGDAAGEPTGGGPTHGEIEFDLSAMRSGNPLVDREAERRLHIKKFPTVTGILAEMRTVEGEPTVFDASGDLTFHGVTRTITGRLRIEECDGVVGLTGSTRIDVTDFDVQPPSLLLLRVHKEVDIELRAFAHPQP